LFGNMLFPSHPSLPLEQSLVFMAESDQLCDRFRYHKHKLILVLAAMRHHRDRLQAEGYNVKYWEASDSSDDLSYEQKLLTTLEQHPTTEIHTYELDDHCLLYTSPSPRDRTRYRMPSSA